MEKKKRAGVENLRPVTERSKEEARELSRRGGKASGKARLERKTARETAQMILSLPAEMFGDKVKAQFDKFEIDTNDRTVQTLLGIRSIIEEKPLAALAQLLAMAGDGATTKVEVTTIDKAKADIINQQLFGTDKK